MLEATGIPRRPCFILQVSYSQKLLPQQMASRWKGWNLSHYHTWYMSFFLHGQHFGRDLSPHRKCVNRDKTGFATKQRKLQQNRFCKKTVEKRSHIKIILSIYLTWYARANNSWNQTNFSTSKMSPHVKFLHIQNFSTSKMSPHLEFLHMTRKFSTDNVRGVRDKYQVC